MASMVADSDGLLLNEIQLKATYHKGSENGTIVEENKCTVKTANYCLSMIFFAKATPV